MSQVVILGAGIAGLAAADRITQNGASCVVVEADSVAGGLSRTFSVEGAPVDLGPHVFFRNEAEVRAYWQGLLGSDLITRQRSSRVYFNGKLIHSPLHLLDAVTKLGLHNLAAIALSFMKYQIRPLPSDGSCETWVINRFGRKLYEMFFQAYNEKIFGVSPSQITKDWADRRIRFSFLGIVLSALSRDKRLMVKEFDVARGGSGTAVERMQSRIQSTGKAQFLFENRVVQVVHAKGRVEEIVLEHARTGKQTRLRTQQIISTIPIPDFIKYLSPNAPGDVLKAALQLRYRNLVTVNFAVPLETSHNLAWHWVDVHDANIRCMRITNFGTFQPPSHSGSTAGLTLEYVCSPDGAEGKYDDQKWASIAQNELHQVTGLRLGPSTRAMVLRIARAYPICDLTCESALGQLREYIGTFANVHSVGRGGMFRYNNIHHSVLTGWAAADAVLGTRQQNPWDFAEAV